MSDQASSENQPNYLELAAEIVSAFVSNNPVRHSDLASLIGNVHAALRSVSQPALKEPERPNPAVPVKKSITPDFLMSLEDGKPYKSLKRHLTRLGLTPAQYREKWGLASDYPMVAPNYAKARSELAKSMGLGQKRKGATKGASKSAARARKK